MAMLFKTPKAPTPQPPAVMPDPEMAGIEARAKARRDVMARAGRASTILGGSEGRRRREDGGTPNFDSYSAKTLST